jgi:hypothetical protein
MVTQESINGALGILVEASIRQDSGSALIGTKILRHATSLQLDYARSYCRIKHKYTDKAITSALISGLAVKIETAAEQPAPLPKTPVRVTVATRSVLSPGNMRRLAPTAFPKARAPRS